ncbi:MAG: hypothetical protein AAB505_01375, partial [Patescibacteria group bacterium]
DQTSQDYGVDPKIATLIARCESNLNHYNRAGEVLRGRVNPQDVGTFQINEKYHLEKSRELGLDIYTLEGNIEYAMWVMDNQGKSAWRWSRRCWDKKRS